MNFQFPTCREMYPHRADQKFDKQLRTQIRFYFDSVCSRPQIDEFVAFLQKHPVWTDIFQQDPYRCNTLLRKYCDKRFNRNQRLKSILTHFLQAEQKMVVEKWQQLVSQSSIVLSKLTEEFSLNLNINEIDPFEGFFSINIQDKHKQHLYDASFTFLENNQLLIASIQGPKGEQAQDQVKLLTKALYGVRPMFMLIIGFKLLSEVWQCKLMGIPHKAQAKYRWNDSSRLLFNYDRFWQENDAIFNGQYWQLPLKIERKNIEEIQSKKRSMYLKRYKMLDQLQQDIMDYIQGDRLA